MLISVSQFPRTPTAGMEMRPVLPALSINIGVDFKVNVNDGGSNRGVVVRRKQRKRHLLPRIITCFVLAAKACMFNEAF